MSCKIGLSILTRLLGLDFLFSPLTTPLAALRILVGRPSGLRRNGIVADDDSSSGGTDVAEPAAVTTTERLRTREDTGESAARFCDVSADEPEVVWGRVAQEADG